MNSIKALNLLFTREENSYKVGELKRLQALRRYDILDTPPDGTFDKMTKLATKVFSVPIAIVSLVDEERIWFKSKYGLEVSQINRDPGLCASAILADDLYLIEDAKRDPRCLTNPLVCGEFGLQFYAAAPLITHDGYRLGTFCIIDKTIRYINSDQQEALKLMAEVVMDEMELRLRARREYASVAEELRSYRKTG